MQYYTNTYSLVMIISDFFGRSEKPSYMEFVDDQHYGYTRLVTNATTLAMEFIRNDDGSKGDVFTLTKTL